MILFFKQLKAVISQPRRITPVIPSPIISILPITERFLIPVVSSAGNSEIVLDTILSFTGETITLFNISLFDFDLRYLYDSNWQES